jgi:3'-phosphoadenosine 5'-phosphosulfate sulfotransferase (PAPS reductase)/FAD synthetase
MKYICVSGGADSTAMALLMWERGEEFEMVFSDTGAELPETYWLLPRLSNRVSKPLHIVSGGSFFQLLVMKGYFLPGPKVRWCTKMLKIIPQDYFAQSKGIDALGLGIRADEPNRQKKERSSYAHHDQYYPLVEAGLGKKEVLALCSKYDLRSPVYDWRSNVSCFCCFFQKKRDWRGLLRNHPTIYEVSAEWERQSSLTSHTKHTWNEYFSLDEFRTATKAQIEMWPEPDAEPCLICMT